jgi:hypothetical protein
MVRTRFVTLAGIAALAAGIAWSGEAAAQLRTSAPNVGLEIDGKKSGVLHGVEGGAITAEVINEPAGPSSFVKKHIGQPKYEELTLQFAFGMGRALYTWIQHSWNMSYERKNVKLVEGERVRTASQCLVTETTIPALDAARRDPAYLTLKIAPEMIAVAPQPSEAEALKENTTRPWAVSGFRFEMPGVQPSAVRRIESFTVKQTTVTDDIGDARDYAKEPGKLEFPNLRITLTKAGAAQWIAWHKSFVVEGNNDEANERSGTLTFVDVNGKDLGSIRISNAGIFRITEAVEDGVAVVIAELYVEKMEFVPLGR